ncbi:polysaccharide biosynthesis/export family protein [Tautonia plasticadhaerens]|uniref:Polysaccharide biosynthesis/export protein n=1 Tax=Tautonia plasticadhaerens TaxID=2527974 RepID=A0A518GYT4_9BACT|nr:polysaccharide biosynthesis/export family protein [Tautonia plasticadhaerens]QDV33764.1 Polysaccharide biosynthesis/export protein [Tautonia plasticadhaerens]
MTVRGGDPLRTARLGAAIGLALLALDSGCALQRRKEERRIPQYGVVDLAQPRELNKVTTPPYVIEPPDELEVIVSPSSVDSAQRLVTVQADGLIDLGLAGDVYVSGLTLAQAEQAVSRRLSARALQTAEEPDDPIEVAVRLASTTRSKVYYVMGAVSSQGAVPINGGETVLQAILQAGLKANSLPEKAYLSRPRPLGHPDLVLRIDWEAIRDRGDTTTNYQIFPGDRVVVPGTKERGLIGTLFGG